MCVRVYALAVGLSDRSADSLGTNSSRSSSSDPHWETDGCFSEHGSMPTVANEPSEQLIKYLENLTPSKMNTANITLKKKAHEAINPLMKLQ